MGFGGNIFNSRGPIGVAVAQGAVYLAQGGPDGGFTFASQDLPQGGETGGPVFHADTSRAIASALKRGKFSGKFAVSALPAGMLRYKTLRLPPMPDEDLEQAIAWEAAERFQTTENDALQHYRAGQVQQGDETREEIIVLAADGATVYDHASAIKHAGLVPIAVDATGAALARVLGDPDQSTLIVDLNQGQAEVVACRGNQVIFDSSRDNASAFTSF